MKLVIVDEADNIIGCKDRDKLTPTDIYRVARLVIVNDRNEILLARRALTKGKDPGVWGLAVEGTVEEGEDYESNIRKEAGEEIGITLGNIEIGPTLRMTGKYNHYCHFFVYHANLDTAALRLQEEELVAVRWFKPMNLRDAVAGDPERFGYNFDLILKEILPLVSN